MWPQLRTHNHRTHHSLHSQRTDWLPVPRYPCSHALDGAVSGHRKQHTGSAAMPAAADAPHQARAGAHAEAPAGHPLWPQGAGGAVLLVLLVAAVIVFRLLY